MFKIIINDQNINMNIDFNEDNFNVRFNDSKLNFLKKYYCCY